MSHKTTSLLRGTQIKDQHKMGPKVQMTRVKPVSSLNINHKPQDTFNITSQNESKTVHRCIWDVL